jgi:predicted methyltransferase MtxX (methanogen marker protein 4)
MGGLHRVTADFLHIVEDPLELGVCRLKVLPGGRIGDLGFQELDVALNDRQGLLDLMKDFMK